ncbi:hypothetical protein ACS0TY_001820 [Phlomoides rotata]
MGFYGPARCGYYRLDRHLITALVERWYPETHTFYFPVGEVTRCRMLPLYGGWRLKDILLYALNHNVPKDSGGHTVNRC